MPAQRAAEDEVAGCSGNDYDGYKKGNEPPAASLATACCLDQGLDVGAVRWTRG